MMTIARDQLSKGDAVTIATIEAAIPALVTAAGFFSGDGELIGGSLRAGEETLGACVTQ
jgi:hypothetical protein